MSTVRAVGEERKAALTAELRGAGTDDTGSTNQGNGFGFSRVSRSSPDTLLHVRGRVDALRVSCSPPPSNEALSQP